MALCDIERVINFQPFDEELNPFVLRQAQDKQIRLVDFFLVVFIKFIDGCACLHRALSSHQPRNATVKTLKIIQHHAHHPWASNDQHTEHADQFWNKR